MSSIIVGLKRHIIINIIIDRKTKLKKIYYIFQILFRFICLLGSKMNRVIFRLFRIIDIGCFDKIIAFAI